MNIVAGIDVIQVLWLAIVLAVTYWLMRLGAGLLASGSGPPAALGQAALKIIPGG